jgi:very-short-patch-repair endonuclease
VPVGGSIADFYCHDARLVVELDGLTHVDREVADAGRTTALEKMGLRVLRFDNRHVFENLPGVLEAIYEGCETRCAGNGSSTPDAPSPNPLPEGEG